ncbi:hypothetical protein DFH09DRAFT_1302770 [Mycena vulgaris]|nr:hypothetical protein DFH09DRAFT_1302770 [Mycena vulgaris]
MPIRTLPRTHIDPRRRLHHAQATLALLSHSAAGPPHRTPQTPQMRILIPHSLIRSLILTDLRSECPRHLPTSPLHAHLHAPRARLGVWDVLARAGPKARRRVLSSESDAQHVPLSFHSQLPLPHSRPSHPALSFCVPPSEPPRCARDDADGAARTHIALPRIMRATAVYPFPPSTPTAIHPFMRTVTITRPFVVTTVHRHVHPYTRTLLTNPAPLSIQVKFGSHDFGPAGIALTCN